MAPATCTRMRTAQSLHVSGQAQYTGPSQGQVLPRTGSAVMDERRSSKYGELIVSLFFTNIINIPIMFFRTDRSCLSLSRRL